MNPNTQQRFIRRREKFDFSHRGIERLAILLDASLKKREWTDTELSHRTGVAISTVGRYAKGDIKFPRLEVLQAIAPFVYKPAKFIGDQVELLDVTFDRWQDLAFIGTENYTEIGEVNMETFSQMMLNAMSANGISQHALESALWRKLDKGASTITPKRLEQLQAGIGEPATLLERGIIFGIIDSENKVYTINEWLDQPEPEIAHDHHEYKDDCKNNKGHIRSHSA